MRTSTAEIRVGGSVVGYVTIGDAVDVSPDPLGESSGLAPRAPSPGMFPRQAPSRGPTFRRGIGPGHRQREQEAHHEKHGPVFRVKYQPRGSADPAKPEHFTTADVKSAVQGEGTKTGKAGVASDVVKELRKAGASDSAIAGILANVTEESNFDPTLRHPDQPHYGGEAHYAHGLYQEGGAEWNNYASWLDKNHPGARWQDPKLQTEFLAQNLKQNYPKVWDRMQGGNKEQAAEAFASGYLKPASNYLAQRVSKFRGRGVPDVDAYGGPVGKPVGVTRLGAGETPKVEPTNTAAPGAMNSPSGTAPNAFIVHHTGGPAGVVEDWRAHRPGVGTQYIMDREGNVHDVQKEFGYVGRGHFRNSVVPGVSNASAVGMEIIAKDDRDITATQRARAIEFIQSKYPGTPVFGHSEVSPSDRTNEGVDIANAIRKKRSESAGN